MESCKLCKHWKMNKISDSDRKYMDHLYELLNEYMKKEDRVLFNAGLTIRLRIEEIKRKERSGNCRRFPTHVETREDHGCGEFKYENL